MLTVDWWSWKCARCAYKVKDDFTVNPQPSLAEVLIRLHIQQHDAEELATAKPAAAVPDPEGQ